MKYVEQIKSVALLLLILLSLALTFTIWTFTPSHETIEAPTTVEEPIAETKNTEEVVRPVKLLFHYKDKITGTIDQNHVQLLIEGLKLWEIQDIRVVQEDAPPETLKSYMHSSNRAVVYYPGLVPFPVFDSITNIVDTAIPESSFDRIVIEWEAPANDRPALYFINTLSGRIYKAAIPAEDVRQFQAGILSEASDYEPYITNDKIGDLPIYVQEGKFEGERVNYLIEEIGSSLFAEALLESPELGLSADLTTQEYMDDTGAFIRENPSTKSISYIQPKAETVDPAIPSDLLFDSLSYVNEHGGWTDKYFYSEMNSLTQQIKYQLYVADLPVFSTTTTTGLDITWGSDSGEEQAYRYIRPIYQLDSEADKRTAVLTSGENVLDALGQLDEQDLSAVSDITPAYKLTRSEGNSLMTFEPAWYFNINGVWTELTSELTGGSILGLE